MARRALLVGIDDYDNMNPLKYCVRDVEALRPLLAFHELDRYPNYHVRTLTSDKERVTRARLYKECEELFTFDDTVLFYFSGHSLQARQGHDGWLVTQDGSTGTPGLAYYELLNMANRSPASSALLIIDSCYSGELGRAPDLPQQYIRIDEGVTILSASRSYETALEDGKNGQGVFTQLLIEGLEGAAADLRGRINAASLYAHVSGGLGPWDQRPTYKCNVTHQRTVRRFGPLVKEEDLQRIPEIFTRSSDEIPQDDQRMDRHQAVIERLHKARLVDSIKDTGGVRSGIRLTCLGRSFWNRALRFRN